MRATFESWKWQCIRQPPLQEYAYVPRLQHYIVL